MTTETRTSFTPGPWRNTGTSHSLAVTGTLHMVETTDAQLGGEHVAWVYTDADARLIAAAPDLYEALDRLTILIVGSAFGPGTGFHNCHICGLAWTHGKTEAHRPECPMPAARAALAKADGR